LNAPERRSTSPEAPALLPPLLQGFRFGPRAISIAGQGELNSILGELSRSQAIRNQWRANAKKRWKKRRLWPLAPKMGHMPVASCADDEQIAMIIARHIHDGLSRNGQQSALGWLPAAKACPCLLDRTWLKWRLPSLRARGINGKSAKSKSVQGSPRRRREAH
jgi:hypothetical protein